MLLPQAQASAPQAPRALQKESRRTQQIRTQSGTKRKPHARWTKCERHAQIPEEGLKFSMFEKITVPKHQNRIRICNFRFKTVEFRNHLHRRISYINQDSALQDIYFY